MKFSALRENLRRELRARVRNKQLTGLELAAQVGFRQAHISNFLNRKRSLSLEGLDKALSAQHLSVLDLLDPAEVNKRASIPPPSEDEFENIFMVDGRVAATEPLILSTKVTQIEKFRRSFLRQLRPVCRSRRAGWERFVAIKAGAEDALSMYPRFLPRATLLIDRHYTSLRPYRKGEANIYAVQAKGRCLVRYLELSAKSLVLRPHNAATPVEIIPLIPGEDASAHVIGRICYVGIET